MSMDTILEAEPEYREFLLACQKKINDELDRDPDIKRLSQTNREKLVEDMLWGRIDQIQTAKRHVDVVMKNSALVPA